MYKLTLTRADRRAMEWIGDRYRHGHELHLLLWLECDPVPEDCEWDMAGDIEFLIPEHIAWTIGEIVDEGLDCIGGALEEKLRALRDSIV